MGYTRSIGRVGALAVALGVGFATGATGIASGEPQDPRSTSTSTGESSSSTASSSTTSSSTAGSDSPNGTGTVDPSPMAPGPSPEPLDGASKTIVSPEGGPVVVVSSSGGTETSAEDEDDATAAAVEDAPAAVAPELEADRTASSKPAVKRSEPALTPLVTNASTESGFTAEHFARSSAQPMTASDVAPTYSLATPAAAAALTTTPTAAAFSLPPVPDLDEVLEEPHTFLVGTVAHLADAILEVFLAPFGPNSPAQSPVLWSIMAFVRDELERMLFFTGAAVPATPSATQSSNLLVNPGAEAGDPSLSGYATVTVPGWDVTGTPTVIEYGTERRFPVPTPTPGPVLPDLLAFPSSDGPIPTPVEGKQFFGGGPVADSTLTQHVNLTAAQSLIDTGGGIFTLSGDLGGFLIDPSRTSVTVDFLDASGVTLGSGALRSVTAWDRLFATGFLHRESSGAIPVGTRSARVVVGFDDRNPVLGNYNNAYADNLSFTVNDVSLTPATLTPPTSHVGDLDHVFMVYLENKGVGQIVGSPNAPYLNSLMNSYGYASNYYGLTHPSDPNYYPIIGGSDFGFNYNCPSNCFPTGTPNLADSIEAAGKTWAGYAEGGGGYSTPTDRLPFLAFSDIFGDQQRVATHLFDIGQLKDDLVDPDSAPNFVWFAADDETNMEGPTDFPLGYLNWALGFLNPAHQYNVAAGDQWLQGQLATIFDSPTWQDSDEKSAIFVTFDEDYNNITTGVGNEGNHIVTIVIPSPAAVASGMRPGQFVADDHYNHYSLLRTIEVALNLGPLTNNDKYAQPMNEFWV